MRESAGAARPLALIAAGGEGTRLGSVGPKALVPCAGKPLLAWCLDAFAASRSFSDGRGLVVLAGRAEQLADFVAAAEPARGQGLDLLVVPGGESRSHSVAAALRAALEHEGTGAADAPDPAGTAQPVLVHDAARIFVTRELVDGITDALQAAPPEISGLVAARRATDTFKLADDAGIVTETPPRERLWAVQTPQAFRRSALAAALGLTTDVSDAELAGATDDASLIEAAGGQIAIFEWTQPNGKITTADDLAAADATLRRSAR